jgi:hypothetical protein
MSETIEAGDTTDRVKPWTIKGIPPEERNAAIAAAEREGLTIGEWLTRAIRTQVQADHRSDRLPVVTEIPASVKADRQSDLADLERMIDLAQKLAAATSEPIVGLWRPSSKTASVMRNGERSSKVDHKRYPLLRNRLGFAYRSSA